MNAYATSRLDGSSAVDLWRRRPWLIASLAAHGVLAACLYTAGPVHVAIQRDAGVRTQVATSLQHTAQREMRRELRTMEEIRDALAESAGEGKGEGKGGKDDAKPGDPAARARELARQIEQVQQKIRAAEMARLLRIPEAEALKRVQREAARIPKPALPKQATPEAQVAQLAQQARAALAQRRAQLLAQQQGASVKPADAQSQPQSQPQPQPKAAQAGHPQGGKAGLGPGGGKLAGQGGAGQGNGRMSGQGGQGGRRGGSGGAANSAGRGAVEALASGLALGAPGAITGSSLDMASDAFSDNRSFGSYVQPPPVDAAALRAGHGRTIGAGGPYANRVFLDAWYVIGPFEGAGHDSQNAMYPPERGIDLDAVYFGKNDLPVRWTFQQDARYPSIPLPRAENAVYYAWIEVEVDRDMDLWVWIGGDDDTKMWFNDRLVWLSGDSLDKPWYRQAFNTLPEVADFNLTEGQRRLHFHKGRNSILLKLYNGVDLMFFSVVLSR